VGVDYSIRSATNEDYEAIVSLYRTFRPNWTPHQQTIDCLNELPSAVCFDDKRLIAFLYCYGFAPDILELANIFVDEKHRNQNIGTELISFLEAEIVKTNYKGLIFSNSDLYKARQEKKEATSFYEKNGYTNIVSTEKTRVFFKAF